MTTFKKGDRVRCVDPGDNGGWRWGLERREYVVDRVVSGGCIAVEGIDVALSADRFVLVEPAPVDYWDESKHDGDVRAYFGHGQGTENGPLAALAVRLLCDVVASMPVRWEMRPQTVTVTLPRDVAGRLKDRGTRTTLDDEMVLADACGDALAEADR